METVKIKGVDIMVPDEKSRIMDKLNSLNEMNLYLINKYQKKERAFPNSNTGCESYCLYLGSIKERMYEEEDLRDFDLWHYPSGEGIRNYSTAIISGNDPGEYASGWPSLAFASDVYRSLMRREVVCGLITDFKIIMEVGLAALGLPLEGEFKYNDALNKFMKDNA